MLNFEYLKFQAKEHFRHLKGVYVVCLICFGVGILIGILLAFSSEGYLSLLVAKNKVLYNMINGIADIKEQFWSRFFALLLPLFLIFLLGLNYYSLMLAFAFIIYQAAVMVLGMAAVVSLYGFSGILSSFFVTLPINLLFFVIIFIFVAILFERASFAKNSHDFLAGFNRGFWIKLLLILFSMLILAFVSSFLVSILLKSAMLSIY